MDIILQGASKMIFTKRRFFINFEKEEKWLNDMASNGYNLIACQFAKYTFQKGMPGEFYYRLELLDHSPSHEDSQNYIHFMKESGVDCVATYNSWVFFRKNTADGPFDIYSDFDSRISHYKKAATLIGILAGVNLFIVCWYAIFSEWTLSSYIAIPNFLVVVFFTPVLVAYIRRMNDLKKEKSLYDQ